MNSALTISFPPQLPVSEKRAAIAEAIKSNQVVVIAGETGSGKTTQLPKICLSLGYGTHKLIGHTQPRRLAARSVAARIAEELNTPLGHGVGYQVRFNDTTSEHTRVKLMTDGILLAEIQQDRLLQKYEVLIIDEAHERSLNIDFLLGYLRTLCDKRKDLKVIITSATIDVEKFSQHFSNAPVITVSGRTYPVEIVYLDPAESQSDKNITGEESSDEDPLLFGVVKALNDISQRDRQQRQSPGDVLVFLSGERDIRDMATELRKRSLPPGTEILPLYARLTQNEQQRIFAPHNGRRIILSTNVAETSLTVPGIRYVIDSGQARISRYSVQSKVQRLPIEPVSQASANQRAGRCGRIGPGVCYRLYSEQDFNNRPLFTDPEIQRTSLSSVILQMLMLKLGDVENFPFVEPPERRAINDGFRQLDELGAIDNNRRLTRLGREMATIPADPNLARMLLEAARRGVLYEVLIIVAALSVQDPRDVPVDKRQMARERHARFSHPESDFLGWVLLWRDAEQQRQQLTQKQFRQYCKDNYLSWLRLREWRETHRQLMLACQSLGYKITTPDLTIEENWQTDYEAVHRSMLPGALGQLGARNPEGLFNSSRGRKFALFPASVLYKKPPRWVLCAELIETSRLFATMAARVEPEWIVDAAPHLLRREYFDAHWEKKRGEVVAYEKISLFGLVIIEKRRVSYGQVDPRACRQIFIREGLIAGDIETRADFLVKNQRLIAEVRRQEEKERRPDILVSEDEMCRFYDERLPANVINVAAMERWLRKLPDQSNTPLHMTPADVQVRAVDETTKRAFPDKTVIQHNTLSVKYRFEPGDRSDGASIRVPLALLPQLTQADVDWAVPGLVAERSAALLKSLPKSLRKQFVPVPDFVNLALGSLKETEKPELTRWLSEQAMRHKRLQIPIDAWDTGALPDYLSPTLIVVDASGTELTRGKNLDSLKSFYAGKTATLSRTVQKHPLEVTGLTDWTLTELPESIELHEGVRLRRYPALKDQQNSVDIILCESATDAAATTERGLARLYMLRTPQQRVLVLNMLKGVEKALGLKLTATPVNWSADALLAAYRLGFDTSSRVPRDKAAFEQLLKQGKSELITVAGRLCRMLTEFYESLFLIHRSLSQLQTRYKGAVDDILAQLEWLSGNDFPASIPAAWLWEYPRYIRAIQLRCEKLAQNYEKDQAITAELSTLHKDWLVLRQSSPDALPEFPWLLQELRVSLFAQNLGTRGPVSAKRLIRLIEQARKGDTKGA